jgi:SAM-dependent methyltransferase
VSQSSQFKRADGTQLDLVPGFRERVLAMPRTEVRPTLAWSDQDFVDAAEERIKRIQRLIQGASARGVELAGTRVLELGCGPGVESLLLAALAPTAEVVGIDLALPLLEDNEEATHVRRLAATALEMLGLKGPIEKVIADLPVRLERMSATDMSFPDTHFDVCWSDKVLEHVKPLDQCLAQMWRVMRPGAVAFHAVDPYYWLKGCHRRGLVDMPWAHARLEPAEVVEVALLTRGRRHAARCESRLAELNQMTLRAWREAIDATPFDVLKWHVSRSDFAERTLAEFPEVLETLLDGVSSDDLVHSAISFWLRRPA